jgi:adenosylmethionine-8-amino-7-oxononanoate aminotransferase
MNESTQLDATALRGHSPAELRAFDRDHAWHPFTPMTDYLGSDPPMIARGEGVRLQDVDGRWYWDGVSMSTATPTPG